jgi:hypothetical protein
VIDLSFIDNITPLRSQTVIAPGNSLIHSDVFIFVLSVMICLGVGLIPDAIALLFRRPEGTPVN